MLSGLISVDQIAGVHECQRRGDCGAHCVDLGRAQWNAGCEDGAGRGGGAERVPSISSITK